MNKKEIEIACEELKLALLESIDLDTRDKNIKLLRQANHYRLSKAREELRNIKN